MAAEARVPIRVLIQVGEQDPLALGTAALVSADIGEVAAVLREAADAIEEERTSEAEQ